MIHPLAYFQRLYVINLPSRADRRREMGAQLSAIGLDWNHPLVQLFPAIRPDHPGGFPSLGARGCFLSHLEVLKSAHARKLERLLILEDDLNFSPGFNDRIGALADNLAASEWMMFYGGHVLAEAPGRPAAGGLLAVSRDVPVRTSHFIALNGLDAIDACIDCLEAMLTRPPGDPAGGPMHVDGAYTWFRRSRPQGRTLLAVPELGYQRSSRTDVHDLKWFDRLPVARQAAAWLRQWKNA